MSFPRFEKAMGCSSAATPGAQALMKWCLEWRHAGNGGIYNCRHVAGKPTISTHGEGRAVDIMFPSPDGRAHASGTALVNLILPHVGKLGIQCIIWNRTIWSASSPKGTYYNGRHPHRDHIHIELTRHASRTLTLATIRAVFNNVPKASIPKKTVAQVVKPKPKPPTEEDDEMTVCYQIKESPSEYWTVAGVWRFKTTADVYQLHVFASATENRTRHQQISRADFVKFIEAATNRADHAYLGYHNSNQIAKKVGVPGKDIK